MVAYEFYLRDGEEMPRLLGILPERRKNSERISHDSIMNWIKKLLGEDDENLNNIYYVHVSLN